MPDYWLANILLAGLEIVDEENLTKIHVDLPNNEVAGGESLWVEDLGDDLYIEDPKENYPIDRVDVSASCVFPVVLKKVVKFKQTLMKEPPIMLGTPDPYTPPKK